MMSNSGVRMEFMEDELGLDLVDLSLRNAFL